MLRQKNDRNTLNLQQPLVSNSQYNIIPPKSVPNQDNLINNKLIFNTNKKLIIDPQNKAKLLKSQPVDYIYKDRTNDKITKSDLTNNNYSNIYNPYIDHNRPKTSLENPDSEKKHKYFQSSQTRYPYWKPLWMQYNDPYIKMYDLTVLVPITNGELGMEQINKVNSYEKNKPNTSNTLNTSKYAEFVYPIPIIVKKKITSDIKKNNKTEFFRLPQTYKHQNKVNRINNVRGQSRGVATPYINTPSRLMRYIHMANNKSQLHKPVLINNTNTNTNRNRKHHKTRYNNNRTGSGDYGGHSGYGGYGYGGYGGHNGYGGYGYPYNYYPFSDYYWYENRYKLPFDLNSALLPINLQTNLSIQSSQPVPAQSVPAQSVPAQSVSAQSVPVQSDQSTNIKSIVDKLLVDKSLIDHKLKKIKKEISKALYTSSNSSKSITSIENFNDTSNDKLIVPEGFMPVKLRIIEIMENNIDNKSKINTENNIIFLILVIMIIVYLYTNVYSKK